MFFLDDEDRKLVDLRRGDYMKAGFALQLVTVRWLGTFLEDPLDVPGEVLDFVAGQLGIENPVVVKRYTERVKTKSDHQQEIRRKYGLRDFADAEAELVEWVAARAWTSGDGPKAIFLDATRARRREGGMSRVGCTANRLTFRPGTTASPARFLWQGRLYTVRVILEHWVISREWRQDPGSGPGQPVSFAVAR